MKARLQLLIFAASCLVLVAVEPTTFIWTGTAGDGKFSTAGNWLVGEVPATVAPDANTHVVFQPPTATVIDFSGVNAALGLSVRNTLELSYPAYELKSTDATGTVTLGTGGILVESLATPGVTITVRSSLGLVFADYQTWNVGENANLRVESTLTEAVAGLGLTKTGAGTLELTGGNTYTERTWISGGTLAVDWPGHGGQVSNLGQSSSDAGNLVIDGGTLKYTGSSGITDRLFTVGAAGATIDTSAGTLDFSNTGLLNMMAAGSRTLTLTGAGVEPTTASVLRSVIGDPQDGVTNLIKSGSGMWSLNAANWFSGTTTITGGTLRIGNPLALQNSLLDYDNYGGTLVSASNTVTLGGLTGSQGLDLTIYMSSTPVALTVDVNGRTDTYAGALTGSGSLTKTGTGTLTLTGSSSFDGGTAITGGTLEIADDANLGAAAGELSFNAGTLKLLGGWNSARTITINSGGGTILTNTYEARLSGTLSGNGAFAFEGPGILELSGDNSGLTGGLTVTNGTLDFTASANLGDSDNVITLDGGLLRTKDHVANFTHPILLVTGGILVSDGFDSVFSGKISGGALSVRAGDGSDETGEGGSITLSNPANDYTGPTRIGQDDSNPATPTLKISADGNLGSAPSTPTANHLVLDGGSLVATASFELKPNRGIEITSLGGAIGVDAGQSLVYAGNILGDGALTKTGAGNLTLGGGTGGVSTFAGGLTVEQGTLTLGRSSYQNITTHEFESSPVGAGTLTLLGGTTLAVTPEADQLNDGIHLANSVYLYLGSNESFTITIDTSQDDLTLSGDISGETGVGLLKTGAGILTLAGPNTFDGGLELAQGTLRLLPVPECSETPLGWGPLTLRRGTTLTLPSNMSLSLNNDIFLDDPNSGSAGASIHVQQENDGMAELELLGSITDGTHTQGSELSLFKTGSGNLKLGGSSTFSGGLVVQEGSVTITTSSQTEGLIISGPVGKGTLMMGGGTKLGAVGGDPDLTLHNDIELGGEVGFGSQGYPLILAGTISEGQVTGSVRIGGNVVFEGSANTFTGPTTVQNGILTISADESLGTVPVDATVGADHLKLVDGGLLASGTVTLAPTRGILLDGSGGSLIAPANTTLTVAGKISSSSSEAVLVKSGEGTVVLSGANTFTGPLDISEGTLEFASGAIGPSGSVTMGGGTLRWAAGNTTDVSNRVALVSSKTADFDTNGNNVTFTSSIGNDASASVLKLGLGTLTLAPSGSAGTLDTIAVDGGKLALTGSTSTLTTSSLFIGASTDSSGVVTVDSGATLEISALLKVGYSGNGALEVTNGSIVNAGDVYIAYTDGTLGSILVQGEQSKLYADIVELTTGLARFTVANGGYANVSGSVNLNTPGSELKIGDGGLAGTLLTGSINSSGVVRFYHTDNVTFSTPITGTGTILKFGSGSLTLAPDSPNSFGGLEVNDGGKIIAGTAGSLGTGGDAGNVIINSGQLQVNSGVVVANPISFGSNAGVAKILSGSGSFSTPVVLRDGAGAAPGVAVGTLTFTNGLTFGENGFLELEVQDLGGALVYDQISVIGGNLTFNATVGAPFTIYLKSLTSSGVAGNLANFLPTLPYQWTIVTAPSLVGFESAITTPSLVSLNLSGFGPTDLLGGTFSLSATSSSLQLNFTPVPEPSTWALLISGLAIVGVGALRRRPRR